MLASCRDAEASPECALCLGVFFLNFYLKRIKTSVILLCLSRGLRDARILHTHETSFLMWTWTLRPSTDVSPTFWHVNSMKSLFVVHIWTAWNILQHVVCVRGSFWIFKKDVVQIICFVRYPTSLVFVIVKPTQNKHTNIETSAAQTYSALYKDSQHSNSQLSNPDADTLYYLCVLATRIETFTSLIFLDVYYLTFILFQWSETPIM
jgi:hypothetical protein